MYFIATVLAEILGGWAVNIKASSSVYLYTAIISPLGFMDLGVILLIEALLNFESNHVKLTDSIVCRCVFGDGVQLFKISTYLCLLLVTSLYFAILPP